MTREARARVQFNRYRRSAIGRRTMAFKWSHPMNRGPGKKNAIRMWSPARGTR